MDTTKIKGKTMAKTPEELTAEWKLNKKRNGYFYYQDVNKDIYVSQWYKLNPAICVKVLAPVPPYDEYKAMQAELAELKEKIKKREELIQCLGSNIDELDVKKSVLIIENNKLRRLLEECVPYVTFKMNIEKNIGCTPPGAYLLTRINAALGESEGK